MPLRRLFQSQLFLLFFFVIVPVFAAEKPARLIPQKIVLKSTSLEGDWKQWIIELGFERESEDFPEEINVLAASDDELWVGTSCGRLFTRRSGEWILQGQLQQGQITGIAVEKPDKVWLSTSDGIRRLERNQDQSWNVTEYRVYHQGVVGFLSGMHIYVHGQDAYRLWGYVDDIYCPKLEKTFVSFAISSEHGLFTFTVGAWHQALLGYWGVNSPRLDLRELIRHRRPTCMLEDQAGHLWVGTEWDGLVRFNAKGRKYADRKASNNQKDGTEFSYFNAADIGCDFDRVVKLALSKPAGIWAVLDSDKSGAHIAHFDGCAWTTLALNKKLNPVCLVEAEPGVLLVGDPSYRNRGIKKVTWQTRKIEPLSGPKEGIRELAKLSNGRIFSATSRGLYEKMKP